MARSIKDMLDDFNLQRKVDFYIFGDSIGYRGSVRNRLKELKNDLAEEESWLSTNPSNTFTQANVARLRREVAEQQRLSNRMGRNDTVICEVKRAVKESERGETYLLNKGVLSLAWEYRDSLKGFEDIFNIGGTKVLLVHLGKKANKFIWENDKETVKLIICDEDDSNCEEIYEVSYSGHCRKLSEEEAEAVREENRRKDRIITERAAKRRKEQEVKPYSKKAQVKNWINQNGHWLRWAIIGFAIWFMAVIIAYMS